MKKNRHFKLAKKIMKYRGSMTNKRANQALDEITQGMKETMPKYIKSKNGLIINLEDILA